MGEAYGRMNLLLTQQASAVAYKDIVSYLVVMVACLAPLVVIMKRPPRMVVGKKDDLPPAH
jgi:hypothetical protein